MLTTGHNSKFNDAVINNLIRTKKNRYRFIFIIKTCQMLTTGHNSKFNEAVINNLRTKQNRYGQV